MQQSDGPIYFQATKMFDDFLLLLRIEETHGLISN